METIEIVSPSFLGMVQVYTNKMASSLKRNATIAHPIHLLRLNLRIKCHIFFIAHGHTLMRLIHVPTFERRTYGGDTAASLTQSGIRLSPAVRFSDELPLTSHRDAIDTKLKVLCKALHKVPECLRDDSARGFQVFICGKAWTVHPNITSYCCDTREWEEMSIVKYKGKFYLFIGCLGCKDDISAIASSCTQYETSMCNANNKKRASLDGSV